MMPPLRTLRLAGVIVWLTCAAACTTSTEVPSLEASLLAFEEQLLQHEEAISECMTQLGFRYEVELPGDWVLEKASTLDEASGGTGVVDLSELPEGVNDAYMAGLSPDELAAFEFAFWGDIDLGGTELGCYAETYKGVWAVDPFEPEIIDESGINLRSAVEIHPEVVAALDRYIGCVASSGFEVADTSQIFPLVEKAEASLDADEYNAYRDAAYAAHDACRVEYDSVFNRVHLELAASPPPGPAGG